MRGKVFALLISNRTFRITPAYAGKRLAQVTPTFGEIGSPLRMRGKALAEKEKQLSDRITPAYAGKR